MEEIQLLGPLGLRVEPIRGSENPLLGPTTTKLLRAIRDLHHLLLMTFWVASFIFSDGFGEFQFHSGQRLVKTSLYQDNHFPF